MPGHWEGDLIIGLDKSAVGTLVERTTRYTMLLHLPRMDGHGETPRVHNGPPLAGHGAEAVRDAIATKITTLPQQLRASLTWDQGSEMAQHVQLRIDTGIEVYFCDPHSPWQRGTNENTNGLLRQYLPKGTDLARHTEAELDAVAHTLNSRPRKTLEWATPAEALHQLLSDPPVAGCCNDPLNLSSTPRSGSANGSPTPASPPRSARVGDAYDNALAETINGLYKTELIKPRKPWRNVDDVELATAEWVDWFNHRRLYEYCGDIPPAELEAAYYAQQPAQPTAELSHR